MRRYAPLNHTHEAGPSGSVAWDDITGKPTEFTPVAHTHLWADITDKPTTFTPAAHTHPWSEITSQPTTLSGTVNLTGDQTIAGVKTFTSNIVLTDHRFIRSAQNYISLRSNDANGVGIRFQANDDTVRGALFANSDGIGFLNAALAWAVRFSLAGQLDVGTVPWARLTSVPTSLSNTVTLDGAQTITGIKTFNAFHWATAAGSSGDNASRALMGFSDDRTDRYSAIGTWRGAVSTRIGLSFFTSNDAVPAERMRLTEGGNLWVAGTIDVGNLSDTTLSRKSAGLLGVENRAIFSHVNTGYAGASVTVSTSAPSGGANGDLWLRV